MSTSTAHMYIYAFRYTHTDVCTYAQTQTQAHRHKHAHIHTYACTLTEREVVCPLLVSGLNEFIHQLVHLVNQHTASDKCVLSGKVIHCI